MNKREVVKAAMRHEEVPYVPWQIGLTLEARELLARHYGTEDVDAALDNHFLMLGNGYGYFEPAGGECVRDYFGVLWDRSEDKDIGVVRGQLLPEPDLGTTRSRTRWMHVFSPTSNRASGSRATGSACSISVFRSLSGRGRCAAWRSC